MKYPELKTKLELPVRSIAESQDDCNSDVVNAEQSHSKCYTIAPLLHR